LVFTYIYLIIITVNCVALALACITKKEVRIPVKFIDAVLCGLRMRLCRGMPRQQEMVSWEQEWAVGSYI